MRANHCPRRLCRAPLLDPARVPRYVVPWCRAELRRHRRLRLGDAPARMTPRSRCRAGLAAACHRDQWAVATVAVEGKAALRRGVRVRRPAGAELALAAEARAVSEADRDDCSWTAGLELLALRRRVTAVCEPPATTRCTRAVAGAFRAFASPAQLLPLHGPLIPAAPAITSPQPAPRAPTSSVRTAPLPAGPLASAPSASTARARGTVPPARPAGRAATPKGVTGCTLAIAEISDLSEQKPASQASL